MHITKLNRATHTYRQTLHAPSAKVFPLLCSVREAECVDGWLPELVISSSEVARETRALPNQSLAARHSGVVAGVVDSGGPASPATGRATGKFCFRSSSTFGNSSRLRNPK